ncbi:hypothetical protein M601_020335 [Cellulophaga baltica 4]|nr:hypothetical protein M601_020335 [Cellulophaga baltica 4]
MPLDINLIEGHSRIEEVRNQVAIKRGPVVYCLESVDLPEDTSILEAYIKGDTKNLKSAYHPEFLGGVTTISGEVLLRKETANSTAMYQKVNQPEWNTFKTTFIPYFTWSNRSNEETEMSVFLPVIWE